MPVVDLGISESSSGLSSIGINLEDARFHACVDLSEYENKHRIVFTPPDGEFELMTYSIRSNVSKPLFTMKLNKQILTSTRFEGSLIVSSHFKGLSSA